MSPNVLSIKAEPVSPTPLQIDITPFVPLNIKQEPISPIKREPEFPVVKVKEELVERGPSVVRKEPQNRNTRKWKPRRQRYTPYSGPNQYNKYDQYSAYYNQSNAYYNSYNTQQGYANQAGAYNNQYTDYNNLYNGYSNNYNSYSSQYNSNNNRLGMSRPSYNNNHNKYRSTQNNQRTRAPKNQNISCSNQSKKQPLNIEIVDLANDIVPPKIMNWKKNSLFIVGIWDRQPMSTEKIALLKREIVKTIMADENNSTKLRIYDCVDQRGWLQVSCKDRMSCAWISSRIKTLKPWPEAQLRTEDFNNIENYLVTSMSVSYNEIKTPQELVLLLQKQNNDLSADKWRINSYIFNDEVLKVNFTLTDTQINELRKIDYKPTVGLAKVTVQFKY